MAYRVKNITDRLFSFEGTVLEPGQVSSELSVSTFQRLMALNYGTALMPVEDGEVPVEEPAPVVVPVVDDEDVEEPVTTGSNTETVEVTVEEPAPEAVVSESPVEPAPKKRGRPRTHQ